MLIYDKHYQKIRINVRHYVLTTNLKHYHSKQQIEYHKHYYYYLLIVMVYLLLMML